MMAAAFSRARSLGRIAVIAMTTTMAACNERTPILDADVVTTAPTAVVAAAPLPPDNISRIAFVPPGNRGGATGRGTIYLDVPARDGGRVVSLRSADDSIVSVPSSIFVAEGAVSAEFSFTTRAVQRDVNVTITASSGDRTISEYVSVWTATTSFLAYTADPGMVNTALVVRLSSDAGGRFIAGCNFDGGGLFGSASGPSVSSVSVSFTGPRGQPILPGIYDNATNTGGTPGNYMNVSSAQSCQGIGRVELHELSMLANGTATSMWFTFEQRCLNKPGAIRGTYRLIVPGAVATPRQCFR